MTLNEDSDIEVEIWKSEREWYESPDSLDIMSMDELDILLS